MTAVRCHTDKTVVAGALISVAVAVLCITPVALARHPFIIWMDGLIERLEPQYREMIIWDYEGGRTTGALQIPGSLDLRGFKVGDFVRARVALNYHLLLRIERLPPPAEDEGYRKALRRLETETGNQAP
ncbi:MAG: hypothetical protein ACREJJ_08230 [Candidatus Methylomirabilales bacterium]